MRIAKPRAARTRPRVTVVVPHYNYGQYLPVAVGSALDQRDVDVDVIIVDDKSTDGSVEVARRLAASDERIQLIEHAENMRHIRTYNDGLSRATGDYVVLLSADDALTKDSLTRSLSLMEANPNVGLVYGRVEWFEDDLPSFEAGRSWWQIWSGEAWIRRLVRRGRNIIANPEVAMRKSVYDDIGGYDPDFPHAGDMYMWLQAAARSDIGFVGGPRQAFYRNHGSNMHSVDFGGVLDDMKQVRDVYRRFFRTDGSQVREAAKLSDRADASVSREALLRGALLAVEGAPDSTFPAFRAFARETSHRAPRTATWSWARWCGGDRLARRALLSVEHLRWKVRSRRTDVLGI